MFAKYFVNTPSNVPISSILIFLLLYFKAMALNILYLISIDSLKEPSNAGSKSRS